MDNTSTIDMEKFNRDIQTIKDCAKRLPGCFARVHEASAKVQYQLNCVVKQQEHVNRVIRALVAKSL